MAQYEPWMQSLSDSHGKAHLPYCMLHLCVTHIVSLVQGSAAGPGVASCPGGGAAVGCDGGYPGCCGFP